MTYKEKLEAAQQLMAEIRAVEANEESTEEEKASISGMLDEFRKLKSEAGQLQEIEMSAAELEAEMVKAAAAGVAPEVSESGEPVGTKVASPPNPLVVDEGTNGTGPSQYTGGARKIVGSDYDDPGEFLHSVWQVASGMKRDERLVYFREDAEGHEEKQMVENVGASGGFLVPTEYLATLHSVSPEQAIVRPRATKIRMRRRQIDIPVLDQTSTTANVPHWFGGMLFYWAEEASAKTITTASFRKVSLTAHKIIGYTRSSDELLDDAAISLSDFLTGPMGFAGGVVWYEDYAFLRGTGAGQPLGIINAGATITVNRAAAGGVSYADLVNMVENFLPSATGVWIAHQSVLSNLMNMQDASGGAAGTGSFIWGSASDGVPSRLLGMPIIFTEKTPRIGTAGDVILADLKYYLLGDRQATTIESTKFDQWAYDQTSWRVVHRVDGQPWLSAPLTYQDGTSQVSPFVILGDVS
jgi:HK97 family phage major capsid protein